MKPMLITSIRDYVQIKGRVDLQNIACHFNLPESALIPMLSFWVKKGMIKREISDNQTNCKTNLCHSCMKCDLDQQAIYTWVT
ncbi:hypothetical protein A9G11_07880 [Gilliamella sp. wkB108]|uniref:FeoC-like transcriptional regulator n=1 Tax=Gilliamella sp. wkB108 TaxID=3120256 RepID=UPI00080E572F|nr:FeoC-like transcriptional regulator [Gilliamella apicola]OCG21901.1 hypothetical protein A9G11_07880 [Gilliamella apicola]